MLDDRRQVDPGRVMVPVHDARIEWERRPVGILEERVEVTGHAAALLFAAGPGAAILNVSSPGGQSYHFSSSYGAGKAGLDRLTADMAIELAPKGVAAVVLHATAAAGISDTPRALRCRYCSSLCRQSG